MNLGILIFVGYNVVSVGEWFPVFLWNIRRKQIFPGTGHPFPYALSCCKKVVCVQCIIVAYCLQKCHPVRFHTC